MRFLVAILLIFSFPVFSQNVPVSPATRWIQLPDRQIEVDGLPWYSENHGNFYRLPERLQESYSKKIWNLATAPSGGRLRFRTDSTTLAIRLEYPYPPRMANMQSFGQSGVALYVGDTYWSTAVADKEAKPGKVYEYAYFDFSGKPRVEREITLYLPLYLGVKVLAIGVDPEAKLSAPPAFSLSKPVVFYGTSITQGCCASQPGMSYEAIVGRRLNVDFVNLGFSGSGKYEPALAHAVAAIDAACYVLDGSNFHSGEALGYVLEPFIKILRDAHPKTPIVVVSMPYSSRELFLPKLEAGNRSERELQRDVVAKLIARGDRNIQFVQGRDLLSPLQGDGLTDGTHPNDLGIGWMADGYTERLAALLKLKPKTK